MTRASIRTLGPILVAAIAALAMAGCESASNMLSSNNATPDTQLAQPATSGSTQTAKVQIAPIIGSPENVARDLQTQLASALDKNRISVASAANSTGDYIVRGYIVAAREKTGSKISYIWDLTDQAGKRVHRVTGEEFAAGAGKDPWTAVTPQVVQSIADKTAAQIASWLPGSSANNIPVAANTNSSTVGTQASLPPGSSGGAAPAAPTSSQPSQLSMANSPSNVTGSITGPVSALVPSVTGAPGDGSTALTGAIQRELTRNGVALASASGAQTYKVEGKVAMGQGKDGKQPIQIDWNVIDPSGKKLGTVSQKNEVPQGSLDGAWGRTADAAAQAAAQGIIKLLPPAKATN